MAFIGRTKDLAFLESCYSKPKAQLVVLYGRRRVGKTECLRQFVRNKPCVWHSCTKDTDAVQLRSFSRRLLAHMPTRRQFLDSFASWQDAFEAIPELEIPGKKLVVIDEFPYAAAGNAALPSILQNVWDELLSQEDVMIVLCGSSIGFMEDELLSEKNPLYGRATGVWKMEPLPYRDAALFFPEYSAQDKLEAYGILGGIPHYLQQFDASLSIGENVCLNILSLGCPLFTETEFLLRQELREPAVYNTILGAVASGETELNGIAQKTMLDTRTVHTYLNKLKELHIVEREFSVLANQQERSKQSRGLWRISDNFIAFWFAAAQPWQSELDSESAWPIWTRAIQPRLNAMLAASFEKICQQWVRRKNAAGELPFFCKSIGRWWHKKHEIDIVGAGLEGEFLLGECKFKNAPVSPEVLLALREKGQGRFSQGKQWFYLFSKNGYANDGAWDIDMTCAQLVQAEELEE